MRWSGLRGAIVQLQAIETGRAAAAQLAATKDYPGAVKSLEKLGAPGLRDKGLQAESAAAKTVDRKFPAVVKQASDIKLALATSPISAEARSRFVDDIDGVMAPLKSPDADVSIAETVKDRLDGVADDIETARTAGEAARGRYNAGLVRSKPLIVALEANSADAEVAPLIRNMALAAGLARDKDYARAADMVEAVVASAATVKQETERGKAAWLISQKLLPKLLADARTLAANDSPVLTAREPKAAAIVARLEALEKQVEAEDVGHRLAYATASKVIDETFVQIAQLNINLEKFGEVGQATEDADARVIAARARIRTSLAALHTALADTLGGNDLPNDASFGARLDTILKAWEKTKSIAITVAELDLPGVLGKLTTLQSDIDAVTRDGGKQFAMHRDQLFTAARAKFDLAETACAAPLAALYETSITDGTRFQAEIDKAVAAVGKAARPADVDAQTTILGTVLQRIQQVASALRSTIGAAREAAQRDAVDARNAVAAFATAVAEAKEAQKHNPLKNDAAVYTPQLEALQSDFSQVESVLPVADYEGLTEASVELHAIVANAQAALAAIRGGRDAQGKSVITLASLTADLKELRAKFDRKDFRANMAVTQATLIDKAEDLSGKLPTMPIPTAAAKLEELEADYEKAKAALSKIEASLKEFDASVATGLKILTEQKAVFAAAPAVYAGYQARIKGCQGAARIEGELEKARKQMLDILVELHKIVTEPAKIAEKQGEAIADAKKAALEAAKFEGEYDSFLVKLKSYGEIKDKDRKDIETLAKNAKKAFDANHDLNAAMIQLGAANQRAEQLHKYPEGQSVATRNNLPKVVAKWKTASGNFAQNLTALETALGTINDEPKYAAAKAESLKMVAAVKPLLNPTAFDMAVGKMTMKGAEPTAMTAGREEGLRIVRRYNAYIDKDFRFMELSGNPFVPGVKTDIVALHLALADLENNLLISL